MTVSPGCTCHSTSSTSAMPSPMSGTFTMCAAMSDVQRAPQRLADTIGAREVGPLLRVRIRRVPPGHALDRCLEMKEAMLLHQRGELGAEAAGARRLVHDHAAARLVHRR